MRRSKHTSIHEAGHATIGRVLGLRGGQATIVSDEARNSAGHSIMHDPYETLRDWQSRGKYRGNEMKSALIGRILMIMAGAEAERVILGRCRGGDSYDRRDIGLIVDEYPIGSAPEEFWEKTEPRLRKHTRTLVRRHRAKIERVAAELMKKGTLSPDDITGLLAMGAPDRG